jgi:hypothetical protein
MKDADYGHLKFKWLSKKPFTPWLPFDCPEGLVFKTEESEFMKNEEYDRLPIFLGSTFGVFPSLDILKPMRNGSLHFILSKSMFSGHVSGLSLRRWNAEKNSFEVIRKWEGL